MKTLIIIASLATSSRHNQHNSSWGATTILNPKSRPYYWQRLCWTTLLQLEGSSNIHAAPAEENIGFSHCHQQGTSTLLAEIQACLTFQTHVRLIQWSF